MRNNLLKPEEKKSILQRLLERVTNNFDADYIKKQIEKCDIQIENKKNKKVNNG